jgi:hypothetical protein
MQLLDDLKEATIYGNLKDEALDSTLENSLCKRIRTWRKPDYVIDGTLTYTELYFVSCLIQEWNFDSHTKGKS